MPRAQSAKTASRRKKRDLGLFSPLMRRIFAVNVIAIAILGSGILYLNQFWDDLLEQRTEQLLIQAEIIAGALGESRSLGPESQTILPEPARQIIGRLVGPTETRARLFAPDGDLIADSRFMSLGRSVYVIPLPPPDEPLSVIGLVLNWINEALDSLVLDPNIPNYAERFEQIAADYEEMNAALSGETDSRLRRLENGDLLISVAVPVQRFRRVLGGLLLSADTSDIRALIFQERLRFLKVFVVSLGVTLLLSVFLGRTIARPIHHLAAAADEVTRNIGRAHDLERFSNRKDEIGALSRSLSKMTRALYHQLDAMENFAADVSHELKNPLSSLRSAVETIQRTEDREVQLKLMQIVQDDVKRLDRLINDISNASRLDAELTRASMEEFDLGLLLAGMVEAYATTSKPGSATIEFEPPPPGEFLMVGIERRIGQVLRNIVDNALSFSPKNGSVHISIENIRDRIEIHVDDEGPGLPPGAAEKIFDRFYSERPDKEAFGTHSGLGLSISKQIIEAHGGTLLAMNRTDSSEGDDKILGARLIVTFSA